MKLVKRALRIGVLVGAVKAGQRIAGQYKANNPNGVGDVNGDGVVDYKDKAEEICRAAGQVFGEVSETVRQKTRSGEYKQKAEDAVRTAGQVIDTVSGKIREKLNDL